MKWRGGGGVGICEMEGGKGLVYMRWRGGGEAGIREMELWMGMESMVRERGWWVRQVTYWFHAEDSLKEDNGCVAYSMVHADICPA